MWIVVTYDVNTQTKEGAARLRAIARACEGYGQRVQQSVFEFQLDDTTWAKLRSRLLAIFHSETDSLRFYYLGERKSSRNEHHGKNPSQDMMDLLVR